ncbi:MAG TPA: glycosyltransferase [Actinomycetota bacterium]|nr:glycosyltransferase [Actinomycetota bacterium]
MFAADLTRALAELGIAQRVAVLRSGRAVEVEYHAPVTVLGNGRGSAIRWPLNPRPLITLGRLLRSWSPDLVLAHGSEPFRYSVASALGQPPVRTIYRRIGAAHPRAATGLRRRAYRALMTRASRVVAIAEALRRETVEVFGVPPDRVRLIPNAVDLDRLRPAKGRDDTRRELGVSADAPVVLSLGALSWEKDPLTHLEVTTLARRHHPDLVHVFAGDGPLRSRLEEAVRSRGLSPWVRVLGTRTDVPDLLAASDLLLVASRYEGMEGMPGCAIEAGAMGLPVAAFAVGAVPEVVLDGTTGRLAPPGEVSVLAELLVQLLEDPEARGRMGEEARAWVRRAFDIRPIARQYVELFEEVVASR